MTCGLVDSPVLHLRVDLGGHHRRARKHEVRRRRRWSDKPGSDDKNRSDLAQLQGSIPLRTQLGALSICWLIFSENMTRFIRTTTRARFWPGQRARRRIGVTL